MKKLYIQLDNNDVAKGFHTQDKKNVRGIDPPPFDFEITEYPKDFKSDVKKYLITEEDNEVIFTMRERYDEYQTYLAGFDYGEDGENVPEEYEAWVLN